MPAKPRRIARDHRIVRTAERKSKLHLERMLVEPVKYTKKGLGTLAKFGASFVLSKLGITDPEIRAQVHRVWQMHVSNLDFLGLMAEQDAAWDTQLAQLLGGQKNYVKFQELYREFVNKISQRQDRLKLRRGLSPKGGFQA